jgi:hypothetical protein
MELGTAPEKPTLPPLTESDAFLSLIVAEGPSYLADLETAIDRARKWCQGQRWANGESLRRDRRPTCRIRIDGETVFLDDKRVFLDMTPEARTKALAFLSYLIDAKGNWTSGGDISRMESLKKDGLHGTRWDRVLKSLPLSLRELIQTDTRKGYRLTTEALRVA